MTTVQPRKLSADFDRYITSLQFDLWPGRFASYDYRSRQLVLLKGLKNFRLITFLINTYETGSQKWRTEIRLLVSKLYRKVRLRISRNHLESPVLHHRTSRLQSCSRCLVKKTTCYQKPKSRSQNRCQI